MGACGPGDNCVACAKGVASSETDCQSFNCSVTLIDAVQPGDQYLINGLKAIINNNDVLTFSGMGSES